MKLIDLFKHLFERGLNWLANRRLDELATLHVALDNALIALKQSETNEDHMRAQLMSLRVENSDPASLGRIGWQVSGFIPQAVVDKLVTLGPGVQEQFVRHVSDKLVAQAIAGIFKVNAKGGTTALVFEPISLDSSKRVLSCWFEGDKNVPGYIAPESQMERLQRLQDGSPEYKSLFAKLLPPTENILK